MRTKRAYNLANDAIVNTKSDHVPSTPSPSTTSNNDSFESKTVSTQQFNNSEFQGLKRIEDHIGLPTTKMSLHVLKRRMNHLPTQSDSRSNNPLLPTIITSDINTLSSQTNP